MLRTCFPLLLSALVLLPSCKKDDDDPAPTATTPTCGVAGARHQASFLGESFCPDLNLFADLGAGVLTVNGMSSSGSTLTLELDSLEPGTYDMTEDANHALFTNLAGAFESTSADPASLTIEAHDATANRIRGSFTGPLNDPLGSGSPVISGSFDMYYLE